MKPIVAAVVLSVTASFASAAEPTRLEDLRRAEQQLLARAHATKGGPQHLLLQERARIDALIDAIERGRSVDPAEVDRALGEAARNPR